MWIVIIPSLINKELFESSYNDLKFMVQNHYYVRTNLIVFVLNLYWIELIVWISWICLSIHLSMDIWIVSNF